MTPAEFDKQISRLESRWKGVYVDEVKRVIWREISSLSGSWFAQTVDNFLVTLRQAPLMPEIGEAVSRERERQWALEKKQHEEDAKAFWNGTYHPDEVKAVCQVIKDRILGKVPDENWASFMKVLENNARRSARGGAA